MYTSVTELRSARYISLTTRRRDGTLASVPVWVVSDDDRRLLVWSGRSSWKVKRIHRDPRVLVAACGVRGKERGPRLEGVARLVDDVDVEALLRRKYGWQKRLLDRVNHRSTATAGAWVTIEIVDGPPPAAPPPR